jgi:hypothetical protein
MTSSGRAFQNSQQPAYVPSGSQAEVRASKVLFEGIVEIAEDAIIAVGVHDLLNDVGKEGVLADIGNWIDAHLSAVETKGRTQ